MREMDSAHLSVWLHCLNPSEDLELALGPAGMSHLSDFLDLPPSYGGVGLQSLEGSADEEFLGSFAAIAATLISLCRKTEQRVYIRIAEALESLDGPESKETCPTLRGVLEVMSRTEILRDPLTEEETAGATDLIKGTRTVVVPGRFDPDKQDPTPVPITLPEPRLVSDFVTAPCRHECSILKPVRHAKSSLCTQPCETSTSTSNRGLVWNGLNLLHDGHGQRGGEPGPPGERKRREGL
jgi:hypothetical protein